MDGRFKAESDNYEKFQSRKSTQKRQKQYFEQRKRQQQNLQITRSGGCSDVQGISGQCIKEHRSLDILNLLNLSTKAQECGSSCLKGRENVEANISTLPGNILTNQPPIDTGMATCVESCRIEEATAPLGGQTEASPKKVLISADHYQNDYLNGKACKPSNWKTVTAQNLGSSVLDLLYDDGPNVALEECPTFEDHVAFSLEGLGKVGTETPVHSPQQLNRISYGNAPSLKGGKKKLSEDINHVVEDIELEVDTMMQDIRVAPISSFSNFRYNEGMQSLATAQDYKHFNDHNTKNGYRDYKHFDDHATKIGSSISQEFLFNSENNNDNIWNVPSSSFLDEKFDNEREYNTSWKKRTFQMGISSMDLLKSGACKMASYAFEDSLPKKRSSAAVAMEGFNMIESPASYSKHQSENDHDLFVSSGARRSRSDGNFDVQSLVPEDVRDNSSLLSEESCSTTAVRDEAITHSPSRSVTGENSKEQEYAFASTGNKCRSQEVRCTSVSNSSKRKPSHHSNSILVEELGAHNNRQFKERYASAKITSGDTSFCQNLETEFAVFGSKNRTEDPLIIFPTPEFLDKPSPSFSGLKNDSNVADSPPSSFTPENPAFGDSTVFSDFGSWPTNPSFSPKFELKGNKKYVAGFHLETPSPGLSAQESVSKDEETKGKPHQDNHVNFMPTKEIFMGNKGWSTEKKMVGDTSTSSNRTQDCEGEKDINLMIAQSLETMHQAEEISSSLNKPDKNERKVDKTKNQCEAEIPFKYKTANEDMENWQSEESKMARRKHEKEGANLSGQVMFESYVFQLLCVQKVLM